MNQTEQTPDDGRTKTVTYEFKTTDLPADHPLKNNPWKGGTYTVRGVVADPAARKTITYELKTVDPPTAADGGARGGDR